ncbi:hypothetical protein N0V93_000505 [Gnomoniopsis smithogilvyi]|uniref:Uncharacterized protein n=1 Tax=Gnomoniopsis smithogilvyi TaxID=1191159 RepID=A0A9W8Z1Q7_9PEZI|nr:hypothetical protein N0V93_000505 [Gnomoniopsis smithogilvyi]
MPTSAGTKVTTGDRPVYREGAGVVTDDSLAAESLRNGGEFAANRNIHEPDSFLSNDPASQKPHETPGEAAANSSQGNPAPTYVNTQYIRDPKGPHGKNVHEDPEMTGRPAKLNVEPGSKEDPAREAEKRFLSRQVGGAPGGGNGSGEQPFEALERETNA